MKRLSLCTHFYNNTQGVVRQIELWREIPEHIIDDVEILAVDDHSDTPYEFDAAGLPFRLFRVVSDIDWNMAGCKNLLFQQASSDWLLFFDIDIGFHGADIAKIVSAIDQLNEDCVYYFPRIEDGEPIEPHVNTMLVHKKTLSITNGFDEDFCGYYGYEDIYFIAQVTQHRISRLLLNNVTVYQQFGSTKSLDRDLGRNRALIESKAEQGFPTAVDPVRFEWVELKNSFRLSFPAESAGHS